jgi:Astacin (Peptidase family M12A)
MHTCLPKRGLIVLTSLVVGAGCADETELPTGSSSNGLVEISYRGVRRIAQRRGDQLIIEGDIAVGPADIWVEEPGSIQDDNTSADAQDAGPIVRRSYIARIYGGSYKWSTGPINYSLGNASAADRQAIRNGLALWTSTVPGLSFSELSGACTGDCLNFNTTPSTNQHNDSPVGRQGGTQTINLQIGPTAGIVAHEVGHSLGAWHEATRSDRGSFIQINWAQVQGCLNSATSYANCGASVCEKGSGTAQQNAVTNGCCTSLQYQNGQCYMAFNFDISSANPQALVMSYDYDSIMQYSATAFSKTGAVTITALQTLPPGVVMGQRSHVSAIDLQSMNVLYPVLSVNSVLFRATGTQNVASLSGREQDIDVRYTCTTGGMGTGATIDTSLLSEGTSTSTCTVQSPLWALGYNYPNTTITTWPGSGLETFSSSTSLAVLNPGLIAVFTRVL